MDILYTPPARRNLTEPSLKALPIKVVTKNISIIYLISLFCLGAATQDLLKVKKAAPKAINKNDIEVQVLTEILSSLRDSLSENVETRANFVQVVTTKRVKLRNNPSLDAEVLGVVESGTVLLSLSDNQDGWVKVTSPMGEVSWVKKELISSI